MHIEGSNERDFWFKWEGDVEPVKIIYEKNRTKALYRVHWEHHFCEPYLDEQKRILVVYDDESTTPYIPAGYMGNVTAISMTLDSTEDPKTGKTCLKVEYKSGDAWGGVLWQSPAEDCNLTRALAS